MFKRLLLSFFIAFATLGNTFSQEIIVPTDSEEFSEYFEKLTKKTKNAFLINEWANTDSLLKSSGIQPAFIQLSQSMAKRNHRLTDFQALFVLNNKLFVSNKLSTEQTKELYSYLENCVKDYPSKMVVEVIQMLSNYFEKDLIYEGKFNKLYVITENFTFKYSSKKVSAFDEVASEPIKETQKEEDFGLFDVWDTEDTEEDPWDSPSLNLPQTASGKYIQLPLVKDLLLQIQNATLVIVSPSDSLILENTSGTIDLFQGTFVGEGGKTTWENVFIPNAYAELDKFSFKIITPQIKAEDATIHYDDYLKAPVKGILEIKGEKRKEDAIASYPRFKSYKNNAEFTKLDLNITYNGGFSLVGNRVFSTALYDNLSTLTVNKGLTNNFTVSGRRFEFTDSLIVSKQVAFNTYLGEDSIYHAAVQFRYEPITKELKLYKVEKGGFRSAMYSDTFHEMDILCDALQWNLNNGKMNFYIIAGKSEVPAVFESFNYYNPDRLRRLSSEVGWNPLMYLGNYLLRKKVNRFTLNELYKLVQKDPNQIKNGIITTMQMGFVDYDAASNSYSLSRKGIHYYKSATGMGDYDDLVLSSVSGSGNRNASIDRESNSLDIAGTQEFRLSDSLGIRFLPKNQEMKMEGSNSFKFQGQIIVKNYRFIGDFDVDYDNFKVNLKRIDTIDFIPIDLYNKGSKKYIGAHVQYGSKGILYLNAPDNKSGRKKLVAYPKLEIPEGAVVFFNNTDRKQKYSDRVQFKIPKISHDSLNVVDMAYEGQFYSGGLIKPITEILTTMPDTSIGFVHKAKIPYELYQTQSTFTFVEPLKMTKKGLTASGVLKHLASELQVSEAYFFDSLFVAKGEKADIKEAFVSSKAYFPTVAINEYNSTWKPFVDSLSIASPELVSFYNGTTKLKGNLVVRTSGLYGQGNLDRDDSETNSKAFKFNKDGFLAGKSIFKIKAENTEAKAILEGQNVDIDFKVSDQIVDISPIEQSFNDSISSSIQFPNAAYRTTINNAKWNIKNKKIIMTGELAKSRFFATTPNQFGLAFNGTGADYDIQENSLSITGVEGVNSVDAIIVPNDRKVIVKGGKLEPFVNAKVLADSLNQYHVIANANITVNSKLSYSGSGSYQFVNVSSDTFNIKMSEFKFAEVDKDGQILNSKKSEKLSTIANAKVVEADSVYLSPKIIYKGDITMLAPFKNLNLNGSVRPLLTKYPFLGGNWINYSGNKSESIQINVDNTLKDGGKPLFAGLHLQGTTSADALYPTFLSAKRYEYDHNIFLANGLFQRDEANKRFVIEAQGKNDSPDRYELYDDQGIIRMEGDLKLLQEDYAKNIQTVGVATVLLDSLQYEFNTMMKYNFPVAPPVLLKMGQSIVRTNLDLGVAESAIDFENPEFISKMSKFTGKKSAENFQTEYAKGHIPLFKFNPKFFATILFSDLKLKWNPVSNSFHNRGRLGISNIGETDINAMMNGYFEIVKNNKTGDEIYLFLEVSDSEWYYLGFKNGQMGIVSSDFEMNQALQAKDGGKSTNKDYEVIAVDLKEAMDYRKKFLINYLGANEEDFKKSSISSSPATLKKVVTPETKTAIPGQKPAPVKEDDGF
ncbi:hypothetical protein SAMN06298216_1434 [Spirosomataceae bacterium TFI 002]|nr:hypothetical protein SAMN06298216_1434 [Spirosomataceae bacterium TFI 002]